MGTPGHMAHPFDVDRVKTGQDLIDYINDAVLRLQNKEIAGSVKWDGINTSFKLITTDDGKKEFRMDRGTSEIGSVIGFNAQSALKKWGTEHGMTQAIVKLLRIFDKALPLIKSELKELGMWDDPTKYFNTEYIEGKSNVQEYTANILAIHSINQFYEKGAQEWRKRAGTSMDRPGLERPIDPKTERPAMGTGIEIPYNKDALASLIEKVQPIAAKAGFEVYGDVPVEFDPEVELDLDAVLNTPISVQITAGGVATNTLREWLHMIEHPHERRVTRADGKSVGALSKDIYMAVLRSAEEGGIPLSDYLESQEDVKDALNGALMYHGTRLLGQAVKNALTSKAGSVGGHEGVVLRGMEGFLVKLTGDFIVQGLASTHGDRSDMLKEGVIPPWAWAEGLVYTETLLTEQPNNTKRVIAIYPGRFQPMGPHHFQTFQEIADEYGVENTFISTTNLVRPGSPLNFKEKKNIMIKHGVPESQIVQTINPYAAAEILKKFNPDETAAVYLVGAKDMDEDPRFNNLDGVRKDGSPAHLRSLEGAQELEGYNQHSYVGVAPHVQIDIPGVGEMCGTSLRSCLKDASPEAFEGMMGWFDHDIYDMLQGKLLELSSSGGGSWTGGSVDRAPGVVGSEKEERHPKDFIGEITTDGGASIEGSVIGTGSRKGPWHNLDVEAENKKQKQISKLKGVKEELVSEVMDYLLGITVG